MLRTGLALNCATCVHFVDRRTGIEVRQSTLQSKGRTVDRSRRSGKSLSGRLTRKYINEAKFIKLLYKALTVCGFACWENARVTHNFLQHGSIELTDRTHSRHVKKRDLKPPIHQSTITISQPGYTWTKRTVNLETDPTIRWADQPNETPAA